ncbi:hypothetical protein PTKIN_Ptkin05aG0004100 [Pterospermum kingtungense]
MSSTSEGSEQTGATETPLSIQKIIERISELHANLARQEQGNTNTAADDQTGTEQDGSGSGNVSQGNSGVTTKQDQGGVRQEKAEDESNKRKEVLHELGKICKELQYMISSFKKLESFETNLREPLKTLEANVDDILKDLPQVKAEELPKQVPINLRVLRNNITRVKIQIPLQHQTANKNSEANQGFQTTVASREAEDLPHLYDEGIFENSYYFEEIEEKYNELDIRHKLCLLCFAIFPENAVIKKRLLRFWWVGENLVLAKDSEDEKKLVGETLDKFVEKGFVEPVRKKSKLQARSYKMNPIVRSCLIKFAKQASFFDYDSEGKPTMDFSSCKKACMVKSEGAPVSWFSDYLKEPANEREKEKRLSSDLVKLQMLFNFPDRKTLMSASKHFNELQTLFNVSKQFPALPIVWFKKMTGINVLYLGTWESSAGRPRHIEVEDIDFLKGLKNMKKLRLLSLQGVSGIPKLPSALCKLENLRILDLRACHSLEKLPDRIGSLKRLTYLDLSDCHLLDDMPKQLNQLGGLEVLKGFVIGDGKNSSSLEDLSELKNLRKLSVNVNTTEFDIDDAGEALNMFEKLEKLKIAWGSGGLAQDTSEEQSEASSPNGGEIKKQRSSATKSSTGKENKGEGEGNEKKVKMGKANSKTKNQDGQNTGSSKSLASKVSKQDSKNQGTGLRGVRSATNTFLFVHKLKARRQERKPKNSKGLENLVKLDLQCFPSAMPPKWLVPEKMVGLTNLCIRGGRLARLTEKGEKKWKVKTLRLKFLVDFKMNWREMQERFPELKYLEKVRCPRITFCPCDANGVWQDSSN